MRRLSVLIIIAAWAAIFLPGLGSLELKGEEGRRILPARAMIQSGDWLVPFSEGEPYYRKPPLVNWSIAAAFKVCGGESEWAARLPGALSVLALALTGFWAGRRIFSESGTDPSESAAAIAGQVMPTVTEPPAGKPDGASGIEEGSEISEPPLPPPTDGMDAYGSRTMMRAGGWPLVLALALLTSIGIVEKGRLAEIEALYVSLTGIGTLTWLALDRTGASPWKKWLLAGLILAAANLAKMPLFLIFFYPMTAVLLWRTGRRRELLHPAAIAGLVLMLAPLFTWQWMAGRRAAAQYSELEGKPQSAVIAQQVSERFDPANFHFAEWAGQKVPGTLLLFGPWALLGLPFLRTVKRRPDVPDADLAFAAATWTTGWLTVLPFTLLPGYLPRYALPALPHMVLGAVFLMHRAFSIPGIPQRWRLATLILRGHLVPLSAASFLLPWMIGMEKVPITFAVVAAALPVVWILVLLSARLGEPLRAVTTVTLIAAWFSLTWAAVWLPHRAANNVIKPPAEQILAAAGQSPVIAALDPGPQPFLFYLGPDCREISRTDQLTPEFTHLLVPARRWDQEKEREKFARRRFSLEALRVKDREEKEFVLIPRDPAGS